MEEEYVEYYDLDMFEEVEEWNESEIRSLIALIKTNEFLFDKSIKDFSNREKKNTWKIIANLLNKSEIEVQKKWKSLRTVFSRKLAQLKEKAPSGSGTDAKKKSTNIEWDYWGDMQFLIPHMRHKSNRTSNFYKQPLSSSTTGPLVSFKSASSETMDCTMQNANVISSEFSDVAHFLTETPNSEILLSSDDSFLHIESSASSIEQKISMSETGKNKYLSNMKCKRKASIVPTPDKFHIKKKKELDSYSARMSEASEYLKETLDTVKQSLR